DGPRHDRVAAAIASDAETAQRAEELRRLSHAMHAAYDSVLDEPVPSEMLRTVIDRGQMPLIGLAAAVAWMTVGGVIGGLIVARSGPDPDTAMIAERPLAREAAYAHAVYVPEVRHPVEVGADEREHLNAWLSKRLANPVVAPDIREAGYQLVGGRLLPDAGRPAAQFMYEDALGTRITLYVRGHGERARDTALRHSTDGNIGVVYWLDGSLAYALAGSLERDRLQDIAEDMYRALNP
ncbi:MAG TPA: anti-sigma factor, partial [Gammaproteobacteria bacterium]|nr:anti-sigma factor [Gammaproteobacteria bacterium]